MLRRASSGRKIWPLDFDGPQGTGLGRQLFHEVGVPGGVHWASSTSDSDIYRPACWRGAHAPRPLSSLYIPRIVAVVPGAGVLWYEAWRELARTGKVLPSIRRGDRCGAGRWIHLVCVVALAESVGSDGVRK